MSEGKKSRLSFLSKLKKPKAPKIAEDVLTQGPDLGPPEEATADTYGPRPLLTAPVPNQFPNTGRVLSLPLLYCSAILIFDLVVEPNLC
jgi:hypothetical protein